MTIFDEHFSYRHPAVLLLTLEYLIAMQLNLSDDFSEAFCHKVIQSNFIKVYRLHVGCMDIAYDC